MDHVLVNRLALSLKSKLKNKSKKPIQLFKNSRTCKPPNSRYWAVIIQVILKIIWDVIKALFKSCKSPRLPTSSMFFYFIFLFYEISIWNPKKKFYTVYLYIYTIIVYAVMLNITIIYLCNTLLQTVVGIVAL